MRVNSGVAAKGSMLHALKTPLSFSSFYDALLIICQVAMEVVES